ncbi:pilin [Candidatus Parcubacteria bacterium]|nr:pilin [Candidatus Parcubacteria bacterium]
MKKAFLILSIVGLTALPLVASAGPFNIIPCGFNNAAEPSDFVSDEATTDSTECDFADFITLIKNVINLLIVLSIPAVMIVLTWVGIILLTAQGDSGKITQAKSTAQSVVWGFVIILSAWLVVHTIFIVLTGQSFNDFLK